jgi:hypothetical protein
MLEKEQIKVKPKLPDDGNRYIFPAGEAAPGANIAPVAPSDPNIAAMQTVVEQPLSTIQSAPQTEFINPGQPQTDPARTVANIAPEAAQAAPVAPALPGQEGQIDGAFNALNDRTKELDSQLDNVLKQREAEIATKIAEDDKNVDKIEPKDFFAGKSTWQKVLGGIGMFLGSITPEGAKNVANIIDREITRDIETQKTNIKLKQDKADQRFKLLMDKYGTQEAALIAKKRDAFGMLDAHLKKLELNARNSETRERLSQGRQEIALKREALSNELTKAYLAANKEAQKGMINGYQGSNQNPTIVKELTDRVSAKNSALASITRLEGLLKKGALVGQDAAVAKQVREDLAAAIAKAKFGRSSDSELEVARGLIPDITSVMQRGSTDKELFKSLKKQLDVDVDAAASAAGYSRALPAGARKIQ